MNCRLESLHVAKIGRQHVSESLVHAVENPELGTDSQPGGLLRGKVGHEVRRNATRDECRASSTKGALYSSAALAGTGLAGVPPNAAGMRMQRPPRSPRAVTTEMQAACRDTEGADAKELSSGRRNSRCLKIERKIERRRRRERTVVRETEVLVFDRLEHKCQTR